MSDESFGINTNFDYVEDITHQIFQDDPERDRSEVSHFIVEMEKKGKKDIKQKDFFNAIKRLKLLNAANKGLTNQIKATTKDLAQMRRLNKELAETLKEIRKTAAKDEASEMRVTNVVNAFRHDMFTVIAKFKLDGEDVNLTRNQLRSIVSWYEKGFVYFDRFDEFLVNTDKVHIYTFGEIVKYVDRMNPRKNCQAVVFGEDPNVVDVVFLKDLDSTKEGAVIPTHVLKSRIRKLDINAQFPPLAVSKHTVLCFMINIDYRNPLHDECIGPL